MGRVYLARDEEIGREVAIKVLPSYLLSEPRSKEVFRMEAQMAGRLNHPSFAAIYDVGEHDGCSYIVMEYVRGGSLAARLEGRLWPPDEAAKLMVNVAARWTTLIRLTSSTAT